MGNFVTLTNVGDRELERIIARAPRRCTYRCTHRSGSSMRLMGTPRARAIGQQLDRLAKGGIRFHTQAVVCPGLNDGAALDRTIADLSACTPPPLRWRWCPWG
jgi:NifB/MoaA-like Fe-S oxidoreductase